MSFAADVISATTVEEALSIACRAALTVGRGYQAHASYVPANHDWSAGTHVRADGGPAHPTAISALFAVQRRLSQAGAALSFRRAPGSETIFAGLSPEEHGAIWLHVAPLHGRRGQILGSIALLHQRELSSDERAGLDEIASVLTAAIRTLVLLARARRDQERLHLMAEATHEALWDWTLATDEVWWGGGIQNLLGSSGESVRLKSAWRADRIHPDDLARVERSLRSAIQSTDAAWREEYRFRRSDGSWLTVEDRAYFLRDAESRAYRLFGSIRDVSPIKALIAGEQLARSEAEAASRAKDEFLAMLSHELRNPLAPIIAAMDLIRMSGYSERTGQVIDRQARHLVRLVDDLMDISRITRGRIELRKEQVPLQKVLARAIEMTKPLFLERRHTLSVRLTSEDLSVYGDLARLAQVLGNLLTNAAKYTEAGGEVNIDASRSSDGCVAVRVRDNGIGISSEMLPKVFDLFVQDAQALDRSRGGLGLGLAIVKNLVESHGGTVAVHSAGRGQGSEFVVRLPEAAGPASSCDDDVPSTPPTGERSKAGARILIVDDNVDAAETLSAVLSVSGMECKVASDGQQAVEAALAFEPSVGILDVGLPGMDGYELARRLRVAHPRAKLVALTGYGRPADKAAALAAGFDEHLTKPVDTRALLNTLHRFLAAP